MTTPKHKSQLQLLGVRTAILGSAILMGVGIFMMTSEMGPSPSTMRGDILSPEYVDLSDMAYDDLGAMGTDNMSEEGTSTMDDTTLMSDEERNVMVEELLAPEETESNAVTTETYTNTTTETTLPMEVMEDTTSMDAIQEKVAAQDILKAQLRGATESYWVAQEDMGPTLYGSAPEMETMNGIGGGMAEVQPMATPESGPEMMLYIAIAIMGAYLLRRKITA